MRKKVIAVTVILAVMILNGCSKTSGSNNSATNTPEPTIAATATPTEATVDAVSTASIVGDEAAFLKAISKDGTWIIALTKDIETDQELFMEGEFKNGKQDDAGNDIIQRKLALYSQDEDRNITARYILTAPKLTVTSPKASIQHGTFKGDLYVGVNDFQLIDSTVDGDVYFTTQEAQSTFQMDEGSKITGEQKLKE